MEEIALGEMGMDVDSFYFLTPRQFFNKMNGHHARLKWEQQEEWQRARMIAYFAIKGHDAKNKIKSPKALFALEGDRTERNEQSKPMTKAEAMALAEKWK